jgi:hypothetical protein
VRIEFDISSVQMKYFKLIGMNTYLVFPLIFLTFSLFVGCAEEPKENTNTEEITAESFENEF